MENKNAPKLDLKKINKIFIWIAFACVFCFTLAISMCNMQFKTNDALKHKADMWCGIALAIVAVILAIVWVSVYFTMKKKLETENTKKIKKIIKDKKDGSK